MPGFSVFEIDRETDATHRIVFESYRFESDLALTLTSEFATRVTPGAFALWGRTVFGEDVSRAAVEQLQRDLRSGALPRVEARLDTKLGSHPAAYDSAQRTILVAEDIVLEAWTDRTGYAATLACVLIEEFGHYLDDLLRHHYAKAGGDAPRDEGARFASLLLTEALSTAGPLLVGVLFIDGVAHDIVADPEEIAEIVRTVLGPLQQLSDERTQSREYADAPAGATAGHHEQREILYLSLLLAGYTTMDAHALVDLARKLNARWRGTSGPAVFYEASKPGKPSPALERVILSYLLGLYRELDQRIRDAPLAADGLPDLGEVRWALEEGEALWNPNSPLAGVIDDIVPFGARQDWIARYYELDPERGHRRGRVRQRALAGERGSSDATGFDPGRVPSSGVNVPDTYSIVHGKPTDSTLDDALNSADRGLGAADTVLSVLEYVGIEVVGSAAVSGAGAVLSVVTFLRGLVIADNQQREAAKGVGMVFAYFGIAAAYRDPAGPPARMTRARVQQEVEHDPFLIVVRDNRNLYRSATPEITLAEGMSEGIDLVLAALNANLELVQGRAARAFEQMVLRARIERLDEHKVSQTYTRAWWTTEIRRRTYEEFIAAIEGPALAVYYRINPDPGKERPR